MKKLKTLFNLSIAILVALSLSAITSGCSDNRISSTTNDKYDEWVDTGDAGAGSREGEVGAINMEAVKEAIDAATDPTDLEERLNQIYEGDELVMVKIESTNDGRKRISAFADYDGNGQIDEENDMKMFSYVVGEKDYEIEGYGYNSYYHIPRTYYDPYHHHHNGVATAFLVGWMLSPSYHPYYTPHTRITVIQQHRTVYRTSTTYTQQVTKNKTYRKEAKKKYGKKYDQAKKETRKKVAKKKKPAKEKRKTTDAKKPDQQFKGKNKDKDVKGNGFLKDKSKDKPADKPKPKDKPAKKDKPKKPEKKVKPQKTYKPKPAPKPKRSAPRRSSRRR